jgi:hypothetical protein
VSNHLITPPPEMVNEWVRMLEFLPDKQVFSEVAQWGADQELEACVKWIEDCGYHPSVPEDFRAARRPNPKPPSLKEQALEVLSLTQKGWGLAEVDLDTIRRALEALPDD